MVSKIVVALNDCRGSRRPLRMEIDLARFMQRRTSDGLYLGDYEVGRSTA